MRAYSVMLIDKIGIHSDTVKYWQSIHIRQKKRPGLRTESDMSTKHGNSDTTFTVSVHYTNTINSLFNYIIKNPSWWFSIFMLSLGYMSLRCNLCAFQGRWGAKSSVINESGAEIPHKSSSKMNITLSEIKASYSAVVSSDISSSGLN